MSILSGRRKFDGSISVVVVVFYVGPRLAAECRLIWCNSSRRTAAFEQVVQLLNAPGLPDHLTIIDTWSVYARISMKGLRNCYLVFVSLFPAA